MFFNIFYPNSVCLLSLLLQELVEPLGYHNFMTPSLCPAISSDRSLIQELISLHFYLFIRVMFQNIETYSVPLLSSTENEWGYRMPSLSLTTAVEETAVPWGCPSTHSVPEPLFHLGSYHIEIYLVLILVPLLHLLRARCHYVYYVMRPSMDYIDRLSQEQHTVNLKFKYILCHCLCNMAMHWTIFHMLIVLFQHP